MPLAAIVRQAEGQFREVKMNITQAKISKIPIWHVQANCFKKNGRTVF